MTKAALEAGKHVWSEKPFVLTIEEGLELKALADKAKQLKERRVQQLGDLVIATGADATDAEILAGALLDFAETTEASRKESWRKRGAAFFQGKARKRSDGTDRQSDGTLPLDSGAASA